MTIAWLYALGSVFLVSLISLIGVFFITLKKEFLGKIIFFLVSLSVGALFGGAFIHLIPPAFESGLPPELISAAVLAGVFVFFILEKFLHWHHAYSHEGSEVAEHYHCEGHPAAVKPVGFLVLTSDALHNFLDGIIIGVSYLVSVEVGVAATIAIFIHEIPQEIGDFGLLLHAGFSRTRALAFNFISASLAALGALLALFAGERIEMIVPFILSAAAGGFIYIAGSDLVPELHKTTEPSKSSIQILAIVVGLLVMFALLAFE
ncbi:MAG: ZIP family metal transporter [Patescibacteria group bacterium]